MLRTGPCPLVGMTGSNQRPPGARYQCIWCFSEVSGGTLSPVAAFNATFWTSVPDSVARGCTAPRRTSNAAMPSCCPWMVRRTAGITLGAERAGTPVRDGAVVHSRTP